MATTAPAGDPGDRQGQRQHDRDAHDRGIWALAGSTPEDAFIVERLKAAGAIILGKANLSEWANFRSGPSSSGWSGIGGQGAMAYVLDRNPCGSSSGSAVAVSADLATVAAVGTETDGSIVCPSGANGLVGIKPTLGLCRAGVVPISAEQDTAGPITRNVTDAAVVLGAMTGIDPADPATADQAGNAYTDYPRSSTLTARRCPIGVWRTGTYDRDGEPIDERHEQRGHARGPGATVVDPWPGSPVEDAYGRSRSAPVRVQGRRRTYLGLPPGRTRGPGAIRRRSPT